MNIYYLLFRGLSSCSNPPQYCEHVDFIQLFLSVRHFIFYNNSIDNCLTQSVLMPLLLGIVELNENELLLASILIRDFWSNDYCLISPVSNEGAGGYRRILYFYFHMERGWVFMNCNERRTCVICSQPAPPNILISQTWDSSPSPPAILSSSAGQSSVWRN